MITRRHALRSLVCSGLGAVALGQSNRLSAQAAAAPTGPYTLPPLPYPTDALEPHIDARTMEIHHGKHHAAYVANLNKAVADYPDLGKKSVEELVAQLDAVPEKIRTAVRNNGGGHLNHSWFWQMMSKTGGGAPKGELGAAVDKAFGSYDGFKEAFSKSALGQFGSGWAWLCWDPTNKVLSVQASANQDNPVTNPSKAMQERYGLKPVSPVPLLGIDVWEHAYYLKYQNRRADYVAAFYNVINWDFVTERFRKASAA